MGGILQACRNIFKSSGDKPIEWVYFPPLIGIGSLLPKSLERSPAVGDFYGTRIEIWAGFGPVRQLLRPFFSCFHGQKKNFKKHFRR